MGALTAALIVRDESKFIEGCLESLINTVDEIVIVDTGSRDDTIEKALRFPVTMYHFDWCDDFSAARNFALDRATGQWILYIDADERFDVPPSVNLANILADRGKIAWRLRFHPRVDWTAYAELRLFRNDPRVKFAGCIHERVQDSIDEVARDDGLAIAECDLVLRHIGYEDDQSQKNPRNIPLLRARLAQDPGHIYSWWHLGQCLQLAGDDTAALAAWASGVAAAGRLPAASRHISDAQSAESLIKLQIARGIDVTALLCDARGLYPDHLSLQWIEATLALESGDHQSARQTLERFAAIDPELFYDPRIAYPKAIFRHLAKEALALCRFRDGDYSEAARLYRLASRLSPEPEACDIKARLAELRAAAVSL